jgi:hypothetical protein
VEGVEHHGLSAWRTIVQVGRKHAAPELTRAGGGRAQGAPQLGVLSRGAQSRPRIQAACPPLAVCAMCRTPACRARTTCSARTSLGTCASPLFRWDRLSLTRAVACGAGVARSRAKRRLAPGSSVAGALLGGAPSCVSMLCFRWNPQIRKRRRAAVERASVCLLFDTASAPDSVRATCLSRPGPPGAGPHAGMAVEGKDPHADSAGEYPGARASLLGGALHVIEWVLEFIWRIGARRVCADAPCFLLLSGALLCR